MTNSLARPSYSEFGLFVQQVARAAGHVLRERFPQPREIFSKGVQDIVTDADFAAQQTIVDLIRSRYPDAAILSEEGIEPPPEARLIWVLDPLDGTSNYARRVPTFSTSIAVVQDGQPVIGAIYDPMRDLLFAAEIDRDATLNAEPIHASEAADISESIVGLDWGRGAEVRVMALDWLHRAGMQCKTIRAIGSSALGLCYIAAGWIDVYYHAALKPWDGAAGQIIAQEAGVQLFNFDRSPWNYTEATCIACCPRLVDWTLASLA
ncbi:MAG TPA: inositol monophosphatase family protein [Anaerolineae bacterium]